MDYLSYANDCLIIAMEQVFLDSEVLKDILDVDSLLPF